MNYTGELKVFKRRIIEDLKTKLKDNDSSTINIPVTINNRTGIANILTRVKDNLMLTIRFKDDIEVGNLKSLELEKIAEIAEQI